MDKLQKLRLAASEAAAQRSCGSAPEKLAELSKLMAVGSFDPSDSRVDELTPGKK
ncbi:MAG: hypothetical protein LBF38_08850 [Deltaproteobacteria bacterium]|nr:hypothetical protein [Deltaproteobacteria bacterium]